MKSGINRKLLLTFGCDIGIFLSVALVFVLTPGPLKSLFVAAPMAVVFLLSECFKKPAGAARDLTDGEKRWHFRVDVAGFSLLAGAILYHALRRNDGDGWHWASFELIILGALLCMLFPDAPLWRIRKRKS